MELDKKLQTLAVEVADLQAEFGQLRAGIREILDNVRTGPEREPVLSPHGSSVELPDTGPRSAAADKLQYHVARAAAKATPVASREAKNGTAKGGGLVLSKGDLDLILGEFRGGVVQGPQGSPQARPGAGLSLDKLAKALRESQNATGRRGAQANGHEAALTLPLGELAQILKEAKDVSSPKAETKDSWPALASGTTTPVPSAAPGPKKAGVASNDDKPSRRLPGVARSGQPQFAAASDTLGRSSGGESAAKLDINLVSNLVRWVGSAKRVLGTQNMRAVVETYMSTGHLTPVLAKTITRLASLDILPDESDYHRPGEDDIADALLKLQGIVYGTGRGPREPVVDFDLSTALSWPVSITDHDKAKAPSDILSAGMPQVSRYPGSDSPPAETPRAAADPAPNSKPVFTGESSNGSVTRQHYEGALSAFRSALDSGPSTDRDGLDLDLGEAERPVAQSEQAPPGEGARREDAVEKGNGPDNMRGVSNGVRTRYPTDLTDAEWRWIETTVPRVKPGGRPSKYERREIVNGILYQIGTGCSWRSLAHDLPPWKIVHHYYRIWREDGTWDVISEALWRQPRESKPQESELPMAWALGGVSERWR